MLKLVLSAFFLFAICAISLAQGYEPAVIIKTNGDTIHGFIESRRWDRSPRKISFKTSLDGRAAQYSPIDIRTFSVANETYESGIVDVDTSPVTLGELSNTSAPQYVRDTVFMQILLRGQKSLLHHKDKEGINHFYIIVNQQVEPLVYKMYLTERKLKRVIAKNQSYKTTLASYLQECPGIQSKLVRTTYEVSSLKKLFNYYYECTNTSPTAETERKEGKFELGIVAGATHTSLKFGGGLHYVVENDYEPSIDPAVGFFCDAKLLRSNHWLISNDFMYTSFNVKGTQQGNESGMGFTRSASFNFHYIKTNHMLQVNLLKQGMLYLGVGFSTGFVIKDDSEILVKYNASGNQSTRPFESRNYEYGGIAGLGFRSGKFSIEGRYEASSGISTYMSVSSSTYRTYFLLKYRLK